MTEQDNVVLQIRGMSHIEVPQRNERFELGQSVAIKQAFHKFADCLSVLHQEVGSGKVNKRVLAASQRLEKACFAPGEAMRLSNLLRTCGPVVNIVTDSDIMMRMPWELFGTNHAGEGDETRNSWGRDHVFERTYPAWESHAPRRHRPLASGRRTGAIAFQNMPSSRKVISCLERFAGNNYERPISTVGVKHKKGSKTVVEYLRRLEIVHLSCLILNLRYVNEPYLVFSDTFLLSLSEIRRGVEGFNQRPWIVLDVCDNTWHLMNDRLLFLQQLIELGTKHVVTSFFPPPRQLTAEFWEYFYGSLSTRERVADALLDARHRLIDTGPDGELGLLFWLYSDMDDSDLDHHESAVVQSGNFEGAPPGHTRFPDITGLTDLVDLHSTDRNVMSLIGKLHSDHAIQEFRSYDSVKGHTKWDKIYRMLEIMQGYGREQTLVVLRTLVELRPTDDELALEVEKLSR